MIFRFLCCVLLFTAFLSASSQAADLPHIVSENGVEKLIVDGSPYLILGGELGNSSASSSAYMAPIWPKLKTMHVNTVLAPVYWDLVEPTEGQFDFSLVDDLLDSARDNDMRLVLLWFGSWKNSMSAYVPSWVKRDQERFPRARDKKGQAQEILSPFSDSNLQADKRAFIALMRYLKKVDGKRHTVIMVQVENEIGMLPDVRDYQPAATVAFNKPVPSTLMDYLQSHRQTLVPEIGRAWESQGYQTKGTWNDVFGEELATEEIFMAWHFARYADAIAQAGKAIYPLPMFVNAALNRPGVKPGDYPSAGPLPHVMDIWKAGAPHIDFLAPDFYNPRFQHWNDLYTRQGDPLFIPEIRFNDTIGAKVFFALGHYNCLGFSPFSIESTDTPADESIAHGYKVIEQIKPLILQHTGRETIDGVWLTKENPKASFTMGDYVFHIRHEFTLGWSPGADAEQWPHAGGLVIQTGPEDYLVAGTGLVITFEVAGHDGKRAGIDAIFEGKFVDGEWVAGRAMNGDQSHQGRHLRIPSGSYGIQKLRLYRYE